MQDEDEKEPTGITQEGDLNKEQEKEPSIDDIFDNIEKGAEEKMGKKETEKAAKEQEDKAKAELEAANKKDEEEIEELTEEKKDEKAKDEKPADSKKEENKDGKGAKPKEEKKDTKPKEEAPPAKEEKKDQKPDGPDKDLEETASRLNPNTSPRVKKVIEDYKTRLTERTNELTELRTKLTQFETELKDVKTRALPKDVEEKLRVQEDIIKELNAERSPELTEKFDKKIQANEEEVLNVFKSIGSSPAAIAARKAAGLSVNALSGILKEMRELPVDKGGPLIEEADEIERLLMENRRLGKERASELKNIKDTFDQRNTQRKQELEKETQRITQEIQGKLKTKFDSTLKENPHIKKLEILSNDSAEEKARKKAHNDHIEDLNVQVGKAFDAIANGDVDTMIDVAFSRSLLIDRNRQNKELKDRVAELEEEVSKYKRAGKASTKNTPPDSKTPVNRNVQDLSAEEILFPDKE